MKKCKTCKFNENNLCINTKHAIIEMVNRKEIAVRYKDIKEIKACSYDIKL